jgi:hypothetical protein
VPLNVARGIVIALAAVYGLFCWVSAPERPFTAPDSAAYLEMQPLVPLGYPAFLHAFGERGALIVQPTLFAIALAAIGLELLALSGRLLLAVGVMLATIVTPDLRAYHASILTESLFASGLVGFVASVLAFTREPSWQRAAMASLLAGMTSMVRRTAWAFLPVVVLMVLVQRKRLTRRFRRVAAAAVCPMVAIVALDQLAASLVHGEAATSLTGRHLFAKAALVGASQHTAPTGDPIRDRLAARLERDFAPIRALVAQAPREIRPVLVLYYESCLQGPCLELLVETAPMPHAQRHALLSEVARARLAAAPLDVLRLAATHYVSLWSPYNYRHPATAAELTRFIAERRPLPLERVVFKVAPDEPIVFAPLSFVRIAQPLVQTVGWITGAIALIVFVGAVRGAASRPAAAASLIALTAHAGLAFTAVGAAGLGRFMVAMWPAVLVSIGLGLWWLYTMASPSRGRGGG